MQSDGEPSIVALKTATLLASPFVELVMRECPVAEHATNGVVESSMHEVKRQTGTLKFSVEAHVGQIVKSHSILRWIPTRTSDAISFFRSGRDGLTTKMRRSGRAWRKLGAELRESVYNRPAVARAVASGMQPKLYVGRYLGHHVRTGSFLIMTTDGVVKAAGFRRMNEENRWNDDRWNALRGLLWDVTERGAEAAEAIHAPRPQIVHLHLTPRRRYVTRADLRKYGVTIGCSTCSDMAVQGRTSKPHTEECRTRSGEQMEHDPEGHERVQVHKRTRDVEPEVVVDWAPVARENEGDPAPVEQPDVEMPVETPVESACVKRGSDAVADNEERVTCDSELRANEAGNTTYKMCWNPRPRRRAGWSPGGVRSVKERNLSQIQRKRSRRQFLL